MGEVAHDYVPALKQWLTGKGIKNSYDSWHGMEQQCHKFILFFSHSNDMLSVFFYHIIQTNFFVEAHCSFSFKGGKGAKKSIKKVASGLQRDAEKSWFSELSDKGINL